MLSFRISNIKNTELNLKQLCPQARITVHGKTPDLDEQIERFRNKELSL